MGPGDFAAAAASMSPAPSPPSASPIPGHQPSGTTPNAKRPAGMMQVNVAQGGDRLLTQSDLSAGFINLQGLQARDEAVLRNIGECVEWNSGLLNALVTRVNSLETVSKVSNDILGKQGSFQQELKADVIKALDLVHKAPWRRPRAKVRGSPRQSLGCYQCVLGLSVGDIEGTLPASSRRRPLACRVRRCSPRRGRARSTG